ncbi:MAG: nucleoside kinase [Bacteroidales bacterium]|nr:nucleoside kinase [Bacteroidales bacterium]
MDNNTRIYCKNTQTYHTVPVGTPISDIYLKLQIKLPSLCVGAKVNNRVEGLRYRVYQPRDIEFIDISSMSGMRVYLRSLCFVLYMAVDEVMPNSRLRIEHPISKGYYCQINNHQKISEDQLEQIKRRMKEIISQDIPFHREECHTSDAVEKFREKNLNDKADLLETSGLLYTNYYRLDNHIDYYYGALLPSTGMLYLFDLQLYNSGMLIIVPQRKDPLKLEETIKQPKMLKAFDEYLDFNYIAGLSNVGKMNKLINKGDVSDLIRVSEALQEKKIAAIADEIAKRKNVKVVLISGPSSSGKTTFSKRLSIQLMTNLIRPVALSLDDYFVSREETPKDENGGYDFESLYALDLKLFNEDLNKLIDGKEINVPTFNFHTGKREYSGKKLKLHPSSILILEGIHALNPELTPLIDDKLKYKIYVSALTTISLDDHNWIPTTDNRLIRRIVRDYQFRHYSAQETISRWESVRAGEDKWIFPYQENADSMFNSAMLYELAVLKKYAEPILREVPKNVPEYAEAYRLERFLAYFKSVHESDIPSTSLLREFLGGSTFNY